MDEWVVELGMLGDVKGGDDIWAYGFGTGGGDAVCIV